MTMLIIFIVFAVVICDIHYFTLVMKKTSAIIISNANKFNLIQLLFIYSIFYSRICRLSNQLRDFSPRANYTDRATAACRQI
jgi:hypothetical protein